MLSQAQAPIRLAPQAIEGLIQVLWTCRDRRWFVLNGNQVPHSPSLTAAAAVTAHVRFTRWSCTVRRTRFQSLEEAAP